MVWNTYLIMHLGTDGNSSMTEVVEKVESLGFTTSFGPTDFIYDWGVDKPSKADILGLGDKLLDILKGSNTSFNLDTHNSQKSALLSVG